MTVCVAALCDDSQTLILAADKMIGAVSIEAELEVEKTAVLHRDWRMMFAGNDITPVPEIIDRVREKLPRRSVSLSHMIQAILDGYHAKRGQDAENKYLAPLGLTMTKFYKDGEKILGKDFYLRLLQEIDRYEFSIQLLIAGFDSRGQGRIFSIEPDCDRGIPFRHDIPGFHAIGSGSIAATHLMYYRELHPKMPARLALLLTYEAKYWGEAASGVGIRTDVYVFRRGKSPVKVDENIIEGILANKLCMKLQPREITPSHLDMLNKIRAPYLKPLRWPSKESVRKEKYKSFLSLVRN